MCRSNSSLNLKKFSFDLSSDEFIRKAVGVIDCFLISAGFDTCIRDGVKSRDLGPRVGDFGFVSLEKRRSRISVDLHLDMQSFPNYLTITESLCLGLAPFSIKIFTILL
jgi:hypothetical protein